jgi:hypothetical protein
MDWMYRDSDDAQFGGCRHTGEPIAEAPSYFGMRVPDFTFIVVIKFNNRLWLWWRKKDATPRRKGKPV